eukprot:2060054-Rhodomonas_salina.2
MGRSPKQVLTRASDATSTIALSHRRPAPSLPCNSSWMDRNPLVGRTTPRLGSFYPGHSMRCPALLTCGGPSRSTKATRIT